MRPFARLRTRFMLDGRLFAPHVHIALAPAYMQNHEHPIGLPDNTPNR